MCHTAEGLQKVQVSQTCQSPQHVALLTGVILAILDMSVLRTGKGMQSNTTLSIKMFNDYIRQIHVSAPTGHLEVTFKRA